MRSSRASCSRGRRTSRRTSTATSTSSPPGSFRSSPWPAREPPRGRGGGAHSPVSSFGATVYIDYYYVIYELAMARMSGRPRGRPMVGHHLDAGEDGRARDANHLGRSDRRTWPSSWPSPTLGEFTIPLGSRRLIVGMFNTLQIFWALAALALWVRWRPRVHSAAREGWHLGRVIAATMAGLGVVVLVAAPVLWRAFDLVARSEYVTQRYFWRSAPERHRCGHDSARQSFPWTLG